MGRLWAAQHLAPVLAWDSPIDIYIHIYIVVGKSQLLDVLLYTERWGPLASLNSQTSLLSKCQASERLSQQKQNIAKRIDITFRKILDRLLPQWQPVLTCVYLHMHKHKHLYVCTHTPKHTLTHAKTHTHMCSLTCTLICMHSHTQTHICSLTHTQIHIHMCALTYTNTHICSLTHTNTHTYMHVLTHTYSCIHAIMNTRMHVLTCMHPHALMHTHTYACTLSHIHFHKGYNFRGKEDGHFFFTYRKNWYNSPSIFRRIYSIFK